MILGVPKIVLIPVLIAASCSLLVNYLDHQHRAPSPIRGAYSSLRTGTASVHTTTLKSFDEEVVKNLKPFGTWPPAGSKKHPFMAAQGMATIHADPECSDVHQKGPRGDGGSSSSSSSSPTAAEGKKEPTTTTRTTSMQVVTRDGSNYPGGMCATLTFNRDGLLISLCASLAGFELYLMEPKTLNLLARYTLPQRPSTSAALMTLDPEKIMLDTSGGAYYYLDHEDMVVLADANQHIQRVGHRRRAKRQQQSGSDSDYREKKKEVGDEWEFYQAADYDVSSYIKRDCMHWTNPFPQPGQCDPITAVTADYKGNIWFVTRWGLVGAVIPSKQGKVVTKLLKGEEMQNGITSSHDGVYVVTTFALYQFNLNDNEDDEIKVEWRAEYDRGTFQKAGMLSVGSGTAPTVFGDFVTVNDNSDEQVNLNIYHRDKSFTKKTLGGKRLGPILCSIPMFEKGASASDNSMIAIGDSIFMENNFGYTNAIQHKDFSRQVIPGGIERYDIVRDEKTGKPKGCKTVWKSQERAPSCVAKLGVETGLLYYYTYEEIPSLGDNEWQLLAVDAHSGKTAWKAPIGTGQMLDNNWGPVTLGPDGTAYIGVLGGIVAVFEE